MFCLKTFKLPQSGSNQQSAWLVSMSWIYIFSVFIPLKVQQLLIFMWTTYLKLYIRNNSRVKSGEWRVEGGKKETWIWDFLLIDQQPMITNSWKARHPCSLFCYCAVFVMVRAEGRIPSGGSLVSSNILVRTVACLSHDSTSKGVSCIDWSHKPGIFSQPS